MKSTLTIIKGIVVLLILQCVSFEIQAQQCSGTLEGKPYDFSSLTNNADDYVMTDLTAKNPYSIRINVCRALVNLGSPACLKGASGCQNWDMPTPKFKSTLGQASTMTVGKLTGVTGEHKGYTLYFTNGTNVNNGAVKMEINLICAEGAGVGTPTAVQITNNDFIFDWNSQVACSGPVNIVISKKASVSGGGIFLILLFCGTALYLAVGSVVNKFVRHQNGLEIIPNIAFWQGFLGLIKDGGRFIMLKTCKRGGYAQV